MRFLNIYQVVINLPQKHQGFYWLCYNSKLKCLEPPCLRTRVAPLYPRVLHLRILTADCITSFYRRDLSISGFWYQGVSGTNPTQIPRDDDIAFPYEWKSWKPKPCKISSNLLFLLNNSFFPHKPSSLLLLICCPFYS